VKTLQLSIRGCPPKVHEALKQQARQNRRSLNKEALTWLEKEAREQKPVTGKEWAKRLREAQSLLTESEHKELAKDIQKGISLMRRENLR
jgi:ribosome-binding protein aMBF1 (putative translation factor)